jgi:hypothetical protein
VGYKRAMLGRLSLLLLLVPGGRAGPRPGPEDGADSPYRRVLRKALREAQKNLVAGLDLVVDHSTWADPWVVESEHFSVRTTVGYAYGAQIARDLEYMRGEWIRLLGEGRPITERGAVWIHPTLGEYNRFGGSFAEHSSMYGSFYAAGAPESPVATFYDSNRTRLGMWVTHSATHQYLERSFGRSMPTWVSEGLASYFALYWDWDYGKRELARLEQSGRLVPLRKLIFDALPAYVGSAEERFLELGMLFHFLLNYCEGTRIGADGDPSTGPFLEFLRATVRGQDTSKLAFVATIEEAAELLEEDFKSCRFD